MAEGRIEPPGVAITVLESCPSPRHRAVTCLPQNAHVSRISFTADGRMLLVTTAAPSLALYVVAWERGSAGRLLATHLSICAPHRSVSTVTSCPSDTNLIVASGRGFIKALRLVDGALKTVQLGLKKEHGALTAAFAFHVWLRPLCKAGAAASSTAARAGGRGEVGPTTLVRLGGATSTSSRTITSLVADMRVQQPVKATAPSCLVIGTQGGELWLLKDGDFKQTIDSFPGSCPRILHSVAQTTTGFIVGCSGGAIRVFEACDDAGVQGNMNSFRALPEVIISTAREGFDVGCPEVSAPPQAVETSAVLTLSASDDDDTVAVYCASGAAYLFDLNSFRAAARSSSADAHGGARGLGGWEEHLSAAAATFPPTHLRQSHHGASSNISLAATNMSFFQRLLALYPTPTATGVQSSNPESLVVGAAAGTQPPTHTTLAAQKPPRPPQHGALLINSNVGNATVTSALNFLTPSSRAHSGRPSSAASGVSELSSATLGGAASLIAAAAAPHITALATCRRRPIFLTAAADCTVRIWDYGSRSSSSIQSAVSVSHVNEDISPAVRLPRAVLLVRVDEQITTAALHPDARLALLGAAKSVRLVNVLSTGLCALWEMPLHVSRHFWRCCDAAWRSVHHNLSHASVATAMVASAGMWQRPICSWRWNIRSRSWGCHFSICDLHVLTTRCATRSQILCRVNVVDK